METRSSPDDPFQNDIIKQALSTDSYSIYNDPDSEKKFFLFDSSEDMKNFLGLTGPNARVVCDAGNTTGGHTANLVLYSDRNFEGRRGRSAGWIFGSVTPTSTSYGWKSYSIDNYPQNVIPAVTTNDFPCVLSLSDLGVMDDKTSSLALSHRPVASGIAPRDFVLAQQNEVAVAVLYNKKNFAGISIVFSVRGYASDLLTHVTQG